MKKICWFVVVAGCAGMAWGAGAFAPPEGFEAPKAAAEAATQPVKGELRAGERAEAPSEEAAETLEIYANALAAEDWSKALFLVDLPPLRQVLLERRLAELRAGNPSLTAKDLEEISATLQTRELAPARLRGILAELWKNAGFAGMKWEVEGWSRLGDGGWVARLGYEGADGARRETPVGLRKGEDGWMIAPDLLERVAAARGPQIPAEVPLPDEVAALAEAYWQARKAGKHGEAWLLMSPRFRESQPPETYAERSAAVEAETGLPVAWKMLHCKQLNPVLLGLGYGVTTTKGEFQTLMIAAKDGERWVLEDVQWRKAEGTAPPPAAPAARPFTTDLAPEGLKTDLKTPLGK